MLHGYGNLFFSAQPKKQTLSKRKQKSIRITIHVLGTCNQIWIHNMHLPDFKFIFKFSRFVFNSKCIHISPAHTSMQTKTSKKVIVEHVEQKPVSLLKKKKKHK